MDVTARARIVARLCAALAALIAGGSIAGRIAGWITAGPVPESLQMLPLTAVCLCLAALGLGARSLPGRLAGIVATLSAGAVAAVAAWTLLAYAAGIPLPLDSIRIFDDVAVTAGHPTPGRMAWATALSLLPTALGIAVSGRGWGRGFPAPWLAALGALPPALAGAGYMIGADVLRGTGFATAMALPTALALLALTAGTFALAPNSRSIAWLTGPGPGAATARTLLPIAVAGPFGAAWLLDRGVNSGIYGSEFRMVLVAALTALVLAAAVILHAARLDRSEALARTSEKRLRRVVQEAPFPVMVHAEDGEISLVSHAWLDLTGYAAHEIGTVADWTSRAYGQRMDTVRMDIDRLYELDGPLDEGDYEIRAADGRTLVWAFRSAPIGHDTRGRRLVVTMAADLTDRRATETRLRLLMREVDHRAKNALAVVQAIVQLSRAEDPAVYAEAVQGRVAAMARAHVLLAASGWSGVDIRSLVEGEVDALRGPDNILDAAGPGASIRAEAAQAVTLVLHELAANAARYGALSRPGGRLRVEWRPDPEEGGLCLDWEEQGGPPAAMPPGTGGFGITLMRQTIEGQLMGRLEMDWQVRGLRCRLVLPSDVWHLRNVSERSEPRESDAATLPHHRERRVLVVEDEALTALALKKLLNDAGFRVLGPVGRVGDALALARTEDPEAAVLDVNLFGETVLPLADILLDRGVPFVFCTGYQNGGGIAEHHRNAPVLTKPVNGNQLIAAVDRLLSGRVS
ncbi:PAS domain S-box protein (plasmid) [Skermanella rosea]|uniref:HWE histidine kinase domain-containing protein n=1 Tax=Skermanella rosea TaxID=1817965 RepID=UPI001E5D0423|nr:HWE histidine kinase domain-containing protein [Skermanella rosea]UEM06927.1 PAS domain S-box protein [Skermanella rosea]